ncbi:hypothetical protein A3A93_01740 [Candidatus Roizmanbacteria bacterium RIFCSPLOWO2_01_FULL_38_12]|uniref:Uncharacterized protein n=1 Tax=Candidatus Roizmanbacteria bacterium RIFCSPLOWO2_01_FULL_38_12 TaxID=1802061 RepID=A0A1F7IYA3_9BACT|nr:MAG: hypothetical protein A2861_02260 [Candidatus Roizmanbacteria bacterium RIFCSPHIGHO2_01_FULL_38_15]OGK34511.1 MAG: hypothetical protein A3F59_04265 [Candidatus Roizmanbacteria bacterium RIFCSPHIGHO2_12_FULL_38_13]OGK48340.1 MAG: hypothetical protein A3A93_01740 [Candidatus Roizmanbacteria bacterium RIFCSPLOWO2_01_FULL_38_12]
MLGILLIFLLLVVSLGYVKVPYIAIRDIALFELFGKTISLYDLLAFLLILWVIEILPWPFRGLATIILLLWLLSFFGIITIVGFSDILLVALVLGIVAYIFNGSRRK